MGAADRGAAPAALRRRNASFHHRLLLARRRHAHDLPRNRQGARTDIVLSWSGLGGGYLISLEPSNDIAGDWGVASFMLPAQSGELTVNGRKAPGSAFRSRWPARRAAPRRWPSPRTGIGRRRITIDACVSARRDHRAAAPAARPSARSPRRRRGVSCCRAGAARSSSGGAAAR